MFGQSFTSPPIDASISAGSLPALTNPGAFLESGMAALNGFGPLSTTYSEPGASVLPPQMAASIAYGVEENWDPASMHQVAPNVFDLRLRAWRMGGYQHSVREGTQLFGSIVETMAPPDKVSSATIPALNLLLERRAFDDARATAFGAGSGDGFTEVTTEESLLAKLMGADTPAQMRQNWEYIGPAVEPGQSNGVAEEPLWGVAAGGLGVTRVTNIFGTDVKPFDWLYLVLTLVENPSARMANDYTPQPKQILQIRGRAGRSIPARNTNMSKTDWAPNAKDVDSMRKGVLVPQEWRECKFNANGPPGGKWTSSFKTAPNTSGNEFAANKMRLNLYEQGVIMCVGQVVEPTPKSTKSPVLLENAHRNVAAYQSLPLITITPFTRYY